jgi:transglutaminase/protease-like cytokinesis protein 3
LSADKAIFRSNPDGLQGKATRYAGKKTTQVVCNGYESDFKAMCPKFPLFLPNL